MKKYINYELEREFSIELPELRKLIGKKPISSKPSYGVIGSTFRAYRGFDKPPSESYKKWAASITDKINKQPSIKIIATRETFLKWHKELDDSLQRHWKDDQGVKELSLSQHYKLVDLYIKWLSLHQFADKLTLEGLVKNANCPLDGKILNFLNKCYSQVLPISKPSMGHIHNKQSYDFCQSLIADFSESCEGSRLLFDYWAWPK